MPKLKTKSGAKKRFKVTANGKVMHAQRGKRHGMIKRTKKQIRQLRGTRVLFKTYEIGHGDGHLLGAHSLSSMGPSSSAKADDPVTAGVKCGSVVTGCPA